jgi:hypothetical protein
MIPNRPTVSSITTTKIDDNPSCLNQIMPTKDDGRVETGGIQKSKTATLNTVQKHVVLIPNGNSQMKIRRAREFTNTFALQYLVSDQQHA